MRNISNGSHSICKLHVHIVWNRKYRYAVLNGDIQHRCRELIRQTCGSLNIQILKGVVSKDHIRLHVSYPPKLSISDMLKRLKGRSAKILLPEYAKLRKKYRGGHLWGIGYGA
jgi:putative transposase